MSRPLTFAAGAAHTGPGSLAGLSIRETAGVAGVVRVWDNTAASGVLALVVTVAANGSANIGPMGLRLERGAFVEIVSGTFEGSVHLD